MKAFTNVTMTKAELLKELRIHQKQDDFIKGSYEKLIGAQFKGCAVGCSLESLSRKKGVAVEKSDHTAYPVHFGIPVWLAKVEDRIFEGLSPDEAKKWPVRFTSAINSGADLNNILRPYLSLICESVLDKFDHGKYPEIKAGIELVIALLAKKKSAKNTEDLINARSGLRAAAAYAAYAAAAAAAYAATYAAYAAAAAATADADADADAAYAAAAATAYAADARYKLYLFLAKGMIKLLKACK